MIFLFQPDRLVPDRLDNVPSVAALEQAAFRKLAILTHGLSGLLQVIWTVFLLHFAAY